MKSFGKCYFPNLKIFIVKIKDCDNHPFPDNDDIKCNDWMPLTRAKLYSGMDESRLSLNFQGNYDINFIVRI